MYFSCGWKAHSHTYTYNIHNTYAHENQLTVFNLSCGNILISFFLYTHTPSVCVFWAILLLWGKTAQASPNHLAQAYFPLHFPGTRFTYYIYVYIILFAQSKEEKPQQQFCQCNKSLRVKCLAGSRRCTCHKDKERDKMGKRDKMRKEESWELACSRVNQLGSERYSRLPCWDICTLNYAYYATLTAWVSVYH